LGMADGQWQGGGCDRGQGRQDQAAAGNAISHVLRSFFIQPSHGAGLSAQV
jgi:hypothetical protein